MLWVMGCIYDLSDGNRVGMDTLLKRVIDEDVRVVFLGEIHTSREIHDFQMEFIRRLYEKDSSITIAYEMFQQPYQKYLDLYVRGKIHEVEMLYKTKWHENWKYDIGLYRQTWIFARDKGVPLLAINVPKSFRDKAKRMSYDRMRKSEYLPPDLEPPDSAYIAQFKAMMGGHTNFDERTFQTFLKAMLIWDEAMAYAIARYVKENPNRRVVVLVGSGHVYNRLGIPKRVERMTKAKTLTVIPLTNLKEDIGKGDYGICW